jgi:hypothetical protein
MLLLRILLSHTVYVHDICLSPKDSDVFDSPLLTDRVMHRRTVGRYGQDVVLTWCAIFTAISIQNLV